MKAFPPRHLDDWHREQDQLRDRGQDPLDDHLEQHDQADLDLERRARHFPPHLINRIPRTTAA